MSSQAWAPTSPNRPSIPCKGLWRMQKFIKIRCFAFNRENLRNLQLRLENNPRFQDLDGQTKPRSGAGCASPAPNRPIAESTQDTEGCPEIRSDTSGVPEGDGNGLE